MEENQIIVDHTDMDIYGNMFVYPSDGRERIKIGEKRKHLHPLFQQGNAVLLHWDTYLDKIYVAGASLIKTDSVKDEVPPVKPQQQVKVAHSEPPPPRGNNTSQRSISISYAKDLVVSGKIPVNSLLAYAEVINQWVSSDITVKDQAVVASMVNKYFIPQEKMDEKNPPKTANTPKTAQEIKSHQ